jgi:hypothetical protein
MMTTMSPTSIELAQRMDKNEDQQDKQGDILTRLTTLLEVLANRVTSIEADNRATQSALVDIGKALVRYEERDTSTQRWVGFVISGSVSLVVGVTMFLVGYYIK